MSKHKKDKKLLTDELQEKCEEYLNGWQRAKADYENLKKQIGREKEAFVKFANLNLITGLIPVYNNLKISFEHLPEKMKDDNWVGGIKQVQKQFKEVLEYNGLEEIVPKKGDKFNPEIHEAVEHTDETLSVEANRFASKAPDSPDIKKVSQVVSSGYKIHGKVFVPAKVIVD